MVDALEENVQPMSFLNSVSNLAGHDMATADVLANSVSRATNYYTGGAAMASGMREKHLSEAIGFIDIFIGETMTVGWNCLMEHGELRIPGIASGVVESRTDDDLETRERRGLQAFSLMARDSDGKETLGVAVTTSYSELMRRDRSSRRNPLHHSVDGIGWPSLLAMAVSVACLLIVFVAVYCYKVKNGLSCKSCLDKNNEDTEDVNDVSLG